MHEGRDGMLMCVAYLHFNVPRMIIGSCRHTIHRLIRTRHPEANKVRNRRFNSTSYLRWADLLMVIQGKSTFKLFIKTLSHSACCWRESPALLWYVIDFSFLHIFYTILPMLTSFPDSATRFQPAADQGHVQNPRSARLAHSHRVLLGALRYA